MATGILDFADAINSWADPLDLRGKWAWVLELDGMWGGYGSIISARPFLRQQLALARGVAQNLYDFERATPPEKLRVAVHIRLGDFYRPDATDCFQGKFNCSIPIEWYSSVCRALQSELGKDVVSFALLSDGTPEETASFEREFAPYTTRHLTSTVCSDLLIMSTADLLVCSPSSFSMTAAFLSTSPYVWFKPQLTPIDGCLSIWGHEPSQREQGSVTRQAAGRLRALEPPATGRGAAVDLTGGLPQHLLASCVASHQRRNKDQDLLFYGVCSE